MCAGWSFAKSDDGITRVCRVGITQFKTIRAVYRQF